MQSNRDLAEWTVDEIDEFIETIHQELDSKTYFDKLALFTQGDIQKISLLLAVSALSIGVVSYFELFETGVSNYASGISSLFNVAYGLCTSSDAGINYFDLFQNGLMDSTFGFFYLLSVVPGLFSSKLLYDGVRMRFNLQNQSMNFLSSEGIRTLDLDKNTSIGVVLRTLNEAKDKKLPLIEDNEEVSLKAAQGGWGLSSILNLFSMPHGSGARPTGGQENAAPVLR